MTTAQHATAVPAGETPAAVCEYCQRPFPSATRLTLHKGTDHPQRIDDAERAAFQDAYLAEEDDLRSFRLRALVVLVLVYFGFLIMYAILA
ncbi:DNA-binding protein [Halobacterium salinarum]|uniref:DNA-binding protein n=1 Tax=Halobacterium salinarum TaxID=2242 RepID=UPI001F368E4D|nr:DNA-binding protein [Halobacterium salinarum]MCF2206707.1 DNA-binding protein [Halobacterium salinarum]MCF2241955.1 DNA-binding protein [Halobacterium salinarum]MDL0120902.1 DNA-binding protein [Halobacterium salinarum]MDL0127448.1 DNA-binding protein [Halobacterium salinarum]MDL0133588.1 DNA-binding protein [Halobacterium salinarum]